MLFCGFELYSRWVPLLGHVVTFTYAISGVNVLLNLSNDQSQKHITLRYTCFYLLGLVDTVYQFRNPCI